MGMLARVLQIPNPLVTSAGYSAFAIECLGLLCARLRSPEDQWSLSTKYSRPQSAISEITNETASYINQRWSHLLGWDREGVVSPDALRIYADALAAFGMPSSSIALFIDCTIRQTCRPGVYQELAYTGYKKYHGMKFQGLVAPNGLLVHLDGPYRAPQNDCGVLNLSKLLETVQEYAIQPGSQEADPPEQRYFQVYGDSAYGVSPVMVSPYSGVAPLMPEQRAWNQAMGGVRISVEHGFGLVLQDWPFLQAFWKQKVWGTACGIMYRVGVLLTNAHACVCPNQTSQRYDCAPPTLEEYFHG
jgi:nuclease HARBI1